jgi:membrane protein
MGLIIGSVIILLIAFASTVLLSSIQQFIVRMIPGADDLIGLLTLFRVVPALVLFGALYLLFVALTPGRYRKVACLKWPGPAFVTIWWLATTALLPAALSSLGGYDTTYGGLAGIIIALFFFFMIGLGVTIGAQLNAALAETPEPTVKDVEEVQAEAAAEAAAKAAEVEKEKE